VVAWKDVLLDLHENLLHKWVRDERRWMAAAGEDGAPDPIEGSRRYASGAGPVAPIGAAGTRSPRERVDRLGALTVGVLGVGSGVLAQANPDHQAPEPCWRSEESAYVVLIRAIVPPVIGRRRKFPIWPLWYAALACLHVRQAGVVLVLGLAIGAVLRTLSPGISAAYRNDRLVECR
jgi:hypothetical protein